VTINVVHCLIEWDTVQTGEFVGTNEEITASFFWWKTAP